MTIALVVSSIVAVVTGSFVFIILTQHFPPPGVFIGILAVIGVLIPLLWERVGPPTKTLVIFFVFVLLLLELHAVYRERRRHERDLADARDVAAADRQAQEKRFTVTLERFNELQTTTLSAIRSTSQLARTSSPVDSVKRRALVLSDEILRFLVARQANAPGLPRRESWQADVDASIRYLQETQATYSERFGARVIAIDDELRRAGAPVKGVGIIDDKSMPSFYRSPTNDIGLRILGESIGSRALTLAD